MFKYFRFGKIAFFLSVCVAALPAWAQFRVELSGVGLTQVPISIAPFKGEADSKISAIVQADLERSGQFRIVPASQTTLDEASLPDMQALRQAGADALVAGSVNTLADGRVGVRFRLWDAVRGQDLGGQNFAIVAPDARLAAHRMADYVYEKLTGDQGAFSTRIAYVSKAANQYQLWVADADGENAQSALTSNEPIISPVWSPDGKQLAYVSFESRKPVIYVHHLGTGERQLIANFKGSNSAPAWSPDGKTLAATLSRDGGSQLFLLSASGGAPRRLMQSGSIDTEPVFAPDGKSLYFVSDRGGSPQIYKVGLDGQGAQRVTFIGNYNISPSVSQDGQWMAYISRVNDAYRLHVMNLLTGEVRALSAAQNDERPSFAPNSKLLVYATQVDNREALMTTTLDGRVKARLTAQNGDIREPQWGPFLN